MITENSMIVHKPPQKNAEDFLDDSVVICRLPYQTEPTCISERWPGADIARFRIDIGKYPVSWNESADTHSARPWASLHSPWRWCCRDRKGSGESEWKTMALWTPWCREAESPRYSAKQESRSFPSYAHASWRCGYTQWLFGYSGRDMLIMMEIKKSTGFMLRFSLMKLASNVYMLVNAFSDNH